MDSASCCEYLSIDKLCASLTGTPKVKIARQLKCGNRKNIIRCCDLCKVRSQCVTSCNYLCKSEKISEQHTIENTYITAVKGLPDSTSPFESVMCGSCFFCNVVMAWPTTKFTIDTWNGQYPNMFACNELFLLPIFQVRMWQN